MTIQEENRMAEKVMDELTNLSSPPASSPQVSLFIHHREQASSGNADGYGGMSRLPGGGASCSICGQHFKEEHLLELHLKINHSDTALKSILLARGESSTTSARPAHSHISGQCTRNRKRLSRAFAKQRKDREGLKRMPEWDDSRPVNAYWAPKRICLAPPERHPSSLVSQEEFMGVCGLVSRAKAVRMKSQSESHEQVDLECQIVAVEGPACGELLQSPRTTRSLISQLSRENAEAVRRRLSICLDSEDQEGSENEALDSAVAQRSVQVCLSAIDISSPLGQRLKKHMKADLVVPPITDIEQHCMTIPVQDEMVSKLRHRANEYPIIHRKRKGIVTGSCHIYRFNRAERREFMKVLKTGLNARSRRLMRRTKKCSVRLTRLRPEVIRYWTVKRRTIVNQEIAIDDDLSIVQVDVPEHLYEAVAVQRLPPVPSHSHMHYREPKNMGQRYIPSQEAFPMSHQGMAAAGRHLAGHSQRSPCLPHPYPSASVGPSSSTPGPVPQFLVKQVSKNWMEIGQESQKLVFVPLEEAGPAQHPNVTVRSLAGGSAQRPLTSSGGIKKSLPRHLRPCPKSQRKQGLTNREVINNDEFVIESASNSSEEEVDNSVRSKPKEKQTEGVYPLSLTRARDMSASPWMLSDKPVPQMLIANSASAGIPVSGVMPFPTALVPVSLLEHHMDTMSGAGLKSGQAYDASGRGLSPSTAASDQSSDLPGHFSIFGMPPGIPSTSLPKHVNKEVEDRSRSLSGVHGIKDNFLLHSISNIHRGDDRHKQQATVSSSTSNLASALQQPNFLQLPPDPPKLYDSNTGDHHFHRSQGNMPRLVRAAHQHGTLHTSANQSVHIQPAGKIGNGQHQPIILRSPTKVHTPPASNAAVRRPAATKGSGVETKPSSKSNKAHSSEQRTVQVVLASDDDVVEVICIDDD